MRFRDKRHPILESLRKENNPVEGVKFMFEAWLSGEISLPPTWRVLVETFQAIDRGELAQEIKHFFNRISVTSPSASLVSHVVYWVHTGAKRLSFSFLIDIRQRKGRARARLVYNPIPGELCACLVLVYIVLSFSFLIDIGQQKRRAWARCVWNWKERTTNQARLQRSKWI